MKKFVTAFLLLLAFIIAGDAQSGRRAAPTPAPTPKADDESQYSESKPRPARVRQVERFPGIGDNSRTATQPVTETAPTKTSTAGDDEVLKVETNLITIPVSVFDRNGLYIPGLRQNDFK